MDDRKIIELYWQRDESAVGETQKKYGCYCYSIAYRILQNREDASECENDTYLAAWNTIPPQLPDVLPAYLGVLTRNISVSRWRKRKAVKRLGSEIAMSLEELDCCIPDDKTVSDSVETNDLAAVISVFLREPSDVERGVFLCRYWHFASVKEISQKWGFSQSKVKMMLLRTREKLLRYLDEEGLFNEV